MTPHHIDKKDIQHRQLESEIEPRHAKNEYGGKERERTGIEREDVGVFHQRLALFPESLAEFCGRRVAEALFQTLA